MEPVLWPSEAYLHQVEQLRALVGQTIYLIELHPTEINLGVSLTGTPHVLLGLIDFPRPDPARGIAPHLILLDDGRGVNLGRIARVSSTPFSPKVAEILYEDAEITRNLLFAEQRLSKGWIAGRSRELLGALLGQPMPTPRLEQQDHTRLETPQRPAADRERP